MVAGSANNQLLTESDGETLYSSGILYAPDYIINAGGIINIEAELSMEGYNKKRAMDKAERIYNVMNNVIHISKKEEISTSSAANRIAEERLDNIRRIRYMRK